ncbi:hypothetical protein ACPYO6_01840 [Georgenia sp. Z1344]|uniref:hypothetical protein n=1 Tax=Georgenia sp. Z1344 TaxID=3416706 RepID=UPI003CF5403B
MSESTSGRPRKFVPGGAPVPDRADLPSMYVVEPRPPMPSAGLVMVGFVLFIPAVVLIALGLGAEAALDERIAGLHPMTVFGLGTAVVGWAVIGVGAVRAARNIDTTAELAYRRAVAEATGERTAEQ